MQLVDTSCWTHYLRRKGDPAIKTQVQSLLDAHEAVWCDVVRIELLNGVTSEFDRIALEALEERVKALPVDQPVWDDAIERVRLARSKGLQVNVTDHLVYACAVVHGIEVLHNDRHFDLLRQLD
jgi:predicted nucleic acid-binding protein